MTNSQKRLLELMHIFAGREAIYDIGQFDSKQLTRLKWAERQGFVLREKRPWPGPLVGTCMKTRYVRVGV